MIDNAIETRGLVGYGSRGLRLVRGRGVEVEDSAGRRYLDCTSMYGVLPLGHAHPRMVETMQRQSIELASCFSSFGHAERNALIEELSVALRPAFGFDCASPLRFFFCNSGTEAVEAALKLARATTARPKILAATRGFHGRTLGATAVTHRAAYRQPFEPLMPGVQHLRFGDLETLRAAIDDTTAAVILELVQGEGGVHPAPEGYLAAVSQLCRDHGALFILDEVQTGMGRCGSLLASTLEDARPDLICLAKGMANGFPMGALIAGARAGEFPPGTHGSTFGGSPLACALARTCLHILEEEDLPERVAARAPAWHHQLTQTSPERIRAVRGRGYLIGIELREAALPIQRALQERGVLALTAGKQVLRLLPPLILNQAQRDQVTTTLAEVLR